MDLELLRKRALVTGGSRGSGKAIARALAHEGVSVALLARDPQTLAGAAGLETPGAGGILDRIRRFLALDRLAVGEQRNEQSGRSQGATLETGRYVADGVYLGVRQGTDGGAPRVGVQIDVLPRVRVRARPHSANRTPCRRLFAHACTPPGGVTWPRLKPA